VLVVLVRLLFNTVLLAACLVMAVWIYESFQPRDFYDLAVSLD